MTTPTTWYRAGTASVAAGSKSVAGTGTLWLSQAQAGDMLALTDANGNLVTALAEVESVTSDTALTLKSIWSGSTLAGQKYAIIRNFTGSLPADLAARLSKLIAQYQISVDEMTELLTSSGTVTLTTLTGETVSVQGLAGMVARLTAAENALEGKEASIAPGTTAQYFRGDKTWQSFAATVLASVLTGLSTASSATVISTDTVLAAFGKLQAQINARQTIAAADTVYSFPAVRPSLLLDFANSKTVDPRISFSRASAATYYGPDGLLKTAAANMPRIDYDPLTGVCKGLLIEEARTNLVTRSGNAGAVVGIVGSGGALPTGWSTLGDSGVAVEVVATGAESGLPFVDVRFYGTAVINYRTISFGNIAGYVTGTAYAGSFFVRLLAGALPAANTKGVIRYNLSPSGTTDIYSSITSAAITTAMLSSQRFVVTGTTAGTPAGTGVFFLQFNWVAGNAIDFTVRLACPQLESGAFPTSYIPTTSAAVTRSAEVAMLTGANFSSWYRQDEGTFVVSAMVDAFVVSRRVLSVNAVSTSERMDVITTTGANTQFLVTDDSVLTVGLTSSSVTANTRFNASASYKKDDFAFSTNGAAPVTDISGTVPTRTQLELGAAVGASCLNGHIQRLAFYPKRLASAEHQAVTA